MGENYQHCKNYQHCTTSKILPLKIIRLYSTIIIFRGACIIMNLHMYNYTGMSLTTSVITEVSLWWFVKDVVYYGCSFCGLLIVKHVVTINNQ